MQLPVEVLEEIFGYVPAKDLDNIQLVCRRWREISGERIWRRQFVHQFGTTEIAPVATRSKTWRNEFLLRYELLRKWKKCSKLTDVTVNSTLVDITNIFVNFATSCNAICFNSPSGLGNILDLGNGRIKRRLTVSKYRQEPTPAACMDGSRFAIMYGFYDGRVSQAVLTKDGTLVAEYRDLKYRHNLSISAVWLAKTRSINKQIRRAVTFASASYDGVLMLTSSLGRVSVKPADSPAVLLEGTMYGSTSVIDGDYLVSLHTDGSLFSFKILPGDGDSPPRGVYEKLATLPAVATDFMENMQLHMCNHYVVVQTHTAIYVVDMKTHDVVQLEIPRGVSVTALSIDKSFAPTKRFLAAGLSNDTVCMWYLPESEAASASVEMAPRIVRGASADTVTDRAQETEGTEGTDEGTEETEGTDEGAEGTAATSVVSSTHVSSSSSRTRGSASWSTVSGTHGSTSTVPDTHGSTSTVPSTHGSTSTVPGIRTASMHTSPTATLSSIPGYEDNPRGVIATPLWIVHNPTGYSLQEGSLKHPITQVALNAAVVLVAGYNGLVIALDTLSGRVLKKVNSRVSKNVLDLQQYSRDGLVPVTHLHIDPNPLCLRGVIAIRPAVQAFDLGVVEERKGLDHGSRRKEARARRRSINMAYSANTHHDLREELDLHDRVEYEDRQNFERDEELRDEYGIDQLDDEEQVAYALMLSQQQEPPVDADDELARVLALSAQEQGADRPDNFDDLYEEPSPSQEDEDLSLAIALSLQLNN